MRILLILMIFISAIASAQSEGEIDITNSKQTLIGKWEFVKTIDQNGKEVKIITVDRNLPNREQMTLNANGPNITINSDGTYIKEFTPDNSDYGLWRIESNNKIEYEMIIPEDSRQGRLIIQTQNIFPNKKWRKDDEGNFLDASSDKIIKLTEKEMKVEYEKDYLLVYKKIAE